MCFVLLPPHSKDSVVVLNVDIIRVVYVEVPVALQGTWGIGRYIRQAAVLNL